MNLDEIIKYLLWIVIFAIALLGLYSLFRSLGVI
jgi:hypothetical protein